MFSAGFDSRKTGLKEPLFRALPTGRTGYVDPDRLSAPETTGKKVMKKATEANKSHSKTEKDTHKLAKEIEVLAKRSKQAQKPQVISQVYDQKNQLSSLIKNAAKNKEALEKRNERVQKSKQLSRSKYGW